MCLQFEMLVRLLSFLILFFDGYCSEEFPVVTTPLGQVRGYYKKSYGGRQIAAFEGIPYAKPPVGERRFEEPEPIEPWSGIWNATSPTECAQTSITSPFDKTSGDEDCLHINVFVPSKQLKPNGNVDVIVHIHGGAYMYGSGQGYIRPDFIMDHDVIFVTFNYRLGILGFLSTEDDVVPGNNGLKDQVLALQWVQDNIANFGGNPNSVTLTGLSAGGSSVHLHYFSDLSRGLFHRGFSQSGLALNPWSIQEQPLSRTKKLADAVGCPTGDTKIIVKCLKQRSWRQILAQMPLFFVYQFLPMVPFGPVVEKKGTKPFLTADPHQLLKTGQVTDIPWLASMTTQEGLFPVLLIIDNLDSLDSDWEQLAPTILEFNHTLPQSAWKTTSQKIRQFYLDSDKINKTNMLKVAQIFTDRIFHANTATAIRLQAKVNKSPVYFYLFGYPGDNNDQKFVSHGADSKYFYTPMFMATTLTTEEHKMKDKLLNMLVSYAKTGEVTFDSAEWIPATYDKFNYLKIDGFEPSDIKMETVEELGNNGFWNSLGLKEGENLPPVKDEL